MQPLDPNIRDYKGATALHRCSHLNVIKLLVDFGCDCNAKDLDGNVALHLKCFGEKNKPSELEAIDLLLHYNADITIQNKKVSLLL